MERHEQMSFPRRVRDLVGHKRETCEGDACYGKEGTREPEETKEISKRTQGTGPRCDVVRRYGSEPDRTESSRMHTTIEPPFNGIRCWQRPVVQLNFAMRCRKSNT